MLLHIAIEEMESVKGSLFSSIFEKEDEELVLAALMLNIYSNDSKVAIFGQLQLSIFQRLVTTENVEVLVSFIF